MRRALIACVLLLLPAVALAGTNVLWVAGPGWLIPANPGVLGGSPVVTPGVLYGDPAFYGYWPLEITNDPNDSATPNLGYYTNRWYMDYGRGTPREGTHYVMANGNHYILMNGAATALRADLTNEVTSDVLTAVTTMTTVTISGWIKPQNPTNTDSGGELEGYVWDISLDDTSQGFRLFHRNHDGAAKNFFRLGYRTNLPSYFYYFLDGQERQLNQRWCHVAASQNGVNGWRFWLDGSEYTGRLDLAGSAPYNTNAWMTDLMQYTNAGTPKSWRPNSFTVGNFWNGTLDAFNGPVDEWKFSTNATEAYITNLMFSGFATASNFWGFTRATNWSDPWSNSLVMHLDMEEVGVFTSAYHGDVRTGILCQVDVSNSMAFNSRYSDWFTNIVVDTNINGRTEHALELNTTNLTGTRRWLGPQNLPTEMSNNNSYTVMMWLKSTPNNLTYDDGMTAWAAHSDSDRCAQQNMLEHYSWECVTNPPGTTTYKVFNKITTRRMRMDERWFHWAVTVTNNTTAKVYIAGELRQTGPTTNIPTLSVHQISKRQASNLDWRSNYQGLMDDFRVYDVVLSQEAIDEIRIRTCPVRYGSYGTFPGYGNVEER
jgi:hypothetical protein